MLRLFRSLLGMGRAPRPQAAPPPPDDPRLELVRYWSSGRIVLLEFQRSQRIPGALSLCRDCIEVDPQEFARNGLALVQQRLDAYRERPPGDETDWSPETRKASGVRKAYVVSVTRRTTGALELRPLLRSGHGRVGPPDWVQELAPPIADEAFHAALEEAFRVSGSKLVS